jgi:predicted GTPase
MSTGTNFSGFTSYKQMVIELTNNLKQLKAFSEKMNMAGNAASIDGVLKRLTEDTFNVAVVGEFKRGKSTLINALMGKDVLPTDPLPTTAALNKITYSIRPFVKIEYKDGRTEDIEIDKLSSYVTKLTEESQEKALTVKEAVVYYPANYCKNGVTIIDTPGLNDEGTMTDVTMSVLTQADAALMVIMAQSPFSEFERDFLESKLIASDIGRVMFVVTGIDLLDEDDVDRVLQNITTRIQEKVIIKAKDTFGADSKEFDEYKRKIGNIKVYGLSAKNALKAKIKGDDSMLAKSCFPDFESALERFLTEDRGAVMLNVPVSRIKTSALEIAIAVQLRENALAMQKDEFDQKYNEAMDEMEKLRSERQAKFSQITVTAQKTYEELIPLISDFYPALENAANKAIDNFPLVDSDFDKKKMDDTQKRLSNAVESAITKTGQETSERIQEKIIQALGKEADRISGFENKFFLATEKIYGLFIIKSNVTKPDIFAGSLLNMFTLGLGSAFTGYKKAGWKGALLGGLSGGVMTAGGWATSLVVITLIGLPFTWPAFLISGTVSSLIGVFGGNKMVGKLFGNSRGNLNSIVKIRESVKDSVKKELDKMKEENNYSEKVRHQIDEAFNTLKDKLRTETDRTMDDIQKQLTQLKVDVAKGEVSSQNEQEDLEKMLEDIDKICASANQISEQLTAVLSRGA